jgi:putative membrane protein
MQASTATPVAVTTAAPPTVERPPPAPMNPPSAATPPAQVLSDEQIAAVANAANSGEIDQAHVAERKAHDARVKQFAKMMVAHHTKAKEQQATLLKKLNVTETENPKSDEMRDHSQKLVASLEAATGPQFDRAYIDLQVNEHEQVLDTIDNVLIPNAKHAELKAALQKFRPQVAAHLQMARDIQGMLESENRG